MRKFLIIQTAFTGDVILATALIESIHSKMPEATLDVLVRKGNESLLENNPGINKILIWNKKENKFRNLLRTLQLIRKEKYSDVINLQRFASSGFLTVFSGAQTTSGFNKNPFSFFFTYSLRHEIGNGKHETERNQQLISYFSSDPSTRPRLYPSKIDEQFVQKFQIENYICIAPGSIWFTKTFPQKKWIEFIINFRQRFLNWNVYLLGSPAEDDLCNQIVAEVGWERLHNLAGKLSFLQSAALMKGARMNYVNDSAPLHIASSMNAPVTAIYCSTVPAFGFGPLSDVSVIIETKEQLTCRPCGLHGYKTCPQQHFRCALGIDIDQLG
ncbi:MAG: glycosyltransferase family 9 protein [Bacteroidetes bacterium]|jgi:heptosyltransferase-2|nr:glycosyltransferase family 9 protein [Bacteroidota bacterium]MBP6400900.1 glycosyltransferase family 9 protein [Bacteroidia bacterium]MBK6838730.1 glycosyltransferase family 9 protein [Bacteroidota bacterium]MBK9524801.1 glycosyltransferase family 9 protein [Bacteroidota bacterium]MBK9542967.1 glycosyltransferase family 9 protein [Bacteroidota bacterium]